MQASRKRPKGSTVSLSSGAHAGTKADWPAIVRLKFEGPAGTPRQSTWHVTTVEMSPCALIGRRGEEMPEAPPKQLWPATLTRIWRSSGLQACSSASSWLPTLRP